MEFSEAPVTPDVEPAVPPTPALDRQSIITHGLVWSGMLQVFLVAANFLSMIVLVRLLSPAEYGLVAAVNGVTALINCFSCGNFIAQAVQLHEGEDPDWGAHWNAAFYIQVGLFLACNAIASTCWFLSPYRPMAPLLHLAAIGFVFDLANQMGYQRLRRDLNYRSLRIVQAVSTVVTVVTSVCLALLGAGPFALIIGYNLLNGAPLGFYLLGIQKWRPPADWWSWPDWSGYDRQLKFGAQLSGSAILAAARGMLESTVLPVTVGYAGVGLLNRAQVLFGTTGGRVAGLVVDTVYPLLPRSAGNPEQFSRHAALFINTILFFSIPGAVFVGMDGPLLSRLLYGQRWIAADPLILPATIAAWSVSTMLVFTAVLQAQNRLRLVFVSNLISAISALPAMAVALRGGGPQSYVSVLATGQVVAALIAAKFSSVVLKSNWFLKGVFPTIIAASAGALFVILFDLVVPGLRIVPRLCADGFIFGTVILLMHRCLFPSLLHDIILRLPGRGFLLRIARFAP